MSAPKILVGMTGSIGMLSMPLYLQYLRRDFSQIKVIMTDAAKEFIPKETISLIAGPVYSQLFPFPSSTEEFSHVQLARWADLFIVLPATANVLAEAALGMSRSLLSSTILCHQKPILFFPNMNSMMWDNPATQKNVSALTEYGHKVIPPKEQIGYEHASGAFKEGKFMQSPDEILEILKAEVQSRSPESILEDTWMETY